MRAYRNDAWLQNYSPSGGGVGERLGVGVAQIWSSVGPEGQAGARAKRISTVLSAWSSWVFSDTAALE